jgi:uncharacterized membrane protein
MGNRSSLALAFGIGVVAGLRSMTAPAAVSWAATTDRLHLRNSPLAFLASEKAARISAGLALGELAGDKTPWIPSRLKPASLSWRLISGGFCGAALCLSADEDPTLGAALGAAGALLGSFAGYEARHRTTEHGVIPDLPAALLEDAIAIATALAVVSSGDRISASSRLPERDAA